MKSIVQRVTYFLPPLNGDFYVRRHILHDLAAYPEHPWKRSRMSFYIFSSESIGSSISHVGLNNYPLFSYEAHWVLIQIYFLEVPSGKQTVRFSTLC